MHWITADHDDYRLEQMGEQSRIFERLLFDPDWRPVSLSRSWAEHHQAKLIQKDKSATYKALPVNKRASSFKTTATILLGSFRHMVHV